MIGHEPFGHADGNGFINVAAPAFLFAESRTDPAADQGKGVPFPMDFQAFGILPLGNQGDKGRDIHLRRTGIDAPGPDQVSCRLRPDTPGPGYGLKNSDSKYCRADMTGPGVNCPRAQREPVCIPLAMSRMVSRSSIFPLPFGDPGQDLQHPFPADPAGDTLSAGFGLGKVKEELGEFHHAGVFIHHDHTAGTHDRPHFLQGIEIDLHIQMLGRDTAPQRASGLNGLESFAL